MCSAQVEGILPLQDCGEGILPLQDCGEGILPLQDCGEGQPDSELDEPCCGRTGSVHILKVVSASVLKSQASLFSKSFIYQLMHNRVALKGC
jgi:hypothetical protein